MTAVTARVCRPSRRRPRQWAGPDSQLRPKRSGVSVITWAARASGSPSPRPLGHQGHPVGDQRSPAAARPPPSGPGPDAAGPGLDADAGARGRRRPRSGSSAATSLRRLRTLGPVRDDAARRGGSGASRWPWSGSPTAGTCASCSPTGRPRCTAAPAASRRSSPGPCTWWSGRRASRPSAATGTRPAGSGASPSWRAGAAGPPGDVELGGRGNRHREPTQIRKAAQCPCRRAPSAVPAVSCWPTCCRATASATPSWWHRVRRLHRAGRPGRRQAAVHAGADHRGRPSPCCSGRPPWLGAGPWPGWCCTWPSGSPLGALVRRGAAAAPTCSRRRRSATSSGSWSRPRWSAGWPSGAGTDPAADGASTMVAGNLVIYAFGLPFLMATVGGRPGQGPGAGGDPFLAGDALKILLAAGLLPGAWALVGRLEGSGEPGGAPVGWGRSRGSRVGTVRGGDAAPGRADGPGHRGQPRDRHGRSPSTPAPPGPRWCWPPARARTWASWPPLLAGPAPSTPSSRSPAILDEAAVEAAVGTAVEATGPPRRARQRGRQQGFTACGRTPRPRGWTRSSASTCGRCSSAARRALAHLRPAGRS